MQIVAESSDAQALRAYQRALNRNNVPCSLAPLTPKIQGVATLSRHREAAQRICAAVRQSLPLHRRLTYNERLCCVALMDRPRLSELARALGHHRAHVQKVLHGERSSRRVSRAIDQALLEQGLIDEHGVFIALDRHAPNTTPGVTP